jgi:hypothetical protein
MTQTILNTDIPPNEIYGHVYEKPQSMHEGDLNWRILHGAISTAKFCFRSGYERSDLCPYCGKQEDLTYLFLSYISFGGISVFKIEFHGDKDFLVRELLKFRITDNKHIIFLGDLSSITPRFKSEEFSRSNLSIY